MTSNVYEPLVTIAIPAYNCSDFIHTCLKSVFLQSYKNYEIVIVDDCSTDTTIKTIKRAINYFDLVDKTKVFTHSINCGCGMTEKHAIEFGTGELVVILDSDDALSSVDALLILVKAHRDNPDASLVYSDFYNCDEKLRPKKVRKCTTIEGSKSYLGEFKEGKYIGSRVLISHVKCFKRSFYDKTEGIDPKLLKAIDKDLVLKLEEVGKFVHVPFPLYFHRIHRDSISNTFKRKSKQERAQLERSRINMYRKAKERRMPKLNSEEINSEDI